MSYKVIVLSRSSRSQSNEHTIPVDPELVSFSELVEPRHLIEGLDLLREVLDIYVDIFVVLGGRAVVIGELTGSFSVQNPSSELSDLVLKTLTESQEHQETTRDGSLLVTHPIFMYTRTDRYVKAVFAFQSKSLYLPPKKQRNLAKYVADQYSERISTNFARIINLTNARNLQRQLEEGDNHLVGLIENSGGAMLLFDESRNVVWANDSARVMFGPTRVSSLSCSDVMTSIGIENRDCFVEATFSTGIPQKGVMKTDNGAVHYSTLPARDSEDGMMRVLVLFIQAETEFAGIYRSQYEKIIDLSNDIIAFLDSHYDVITVNSTFTDILGYRKEETVSMSARVFVSEDNQIQFDSVLESAHKAGMAIGHLSFVRSDGSEVPVICSVSYDSENDVYEMVVRNISEKVRLENELREKTRLLEEQNSIMADSARAKDRFFRNVSHELRNPLTSIIGFSQLLSEDDSAPLNRSQIHNVHMVSANAKKVLGLVNDLLQITKIDSDNTTTQYSNVDLKRLTERVVAEQRPMADEKNIKLEMVCRDESVMLRTDQKMAVQIITNIVSNAVKYTHEGYVRTELTCADGFAKIIVEDSGEGISPEDIDKIFEEFYRASRHKDDENGTGLGLAIAKKVATLLGGDIEVESSEGKGSRFTITIPVDPPNPTPAQNI